jgi:hypothetical protein
MHRDRGSDGHRKNMSITMTLVFPSIPKGDIVEILVFIDVNPWRSSIAPKVWLWNS